MDMESSISLNTLAIYWRARSVRESIVLILPSPIRFLASAYPE